MSPRLDGLLEGLATTRTIRRYTAEPVPDADLSTILWHATRAPSGSNRQPVRYLVLRDDGGAAQEARRLIGEAARAVWNGKYERDGYKDDCPQIDDIVAYYVYFAPTQNDELVIIDTVTVSEYTHVRTENSLTGCYAIQGEDEAGNIGELSELNCVEDCADYELPNTFTTNDDGQNDLFTPILPYSGVVKIEMKIFNRWGNLVFETEDPDINWDGTDMKSGKALDSGVFFYVCKVFVNSLDGVKAIESPLEGYIHLYR